MKYPISFLAVSFLAVLLVMASPVLAAEEDPPIEAKPVLVLAPEVLPVTKALPEPRMDIPVPDEKPPGCWKSMKNERLEAMQYTMLIGLVMELPADIVLPATLSVPPMMYLGCRIQQKRGK